MIKYYCDRCDNEVKDHDVYVIQKLSADIEKPLYEGYLCGACLEELKKWIKEYY